MTTMEAVAVAQGHARVSQSALKQALTAVKPAVAGKSTLPVLHNVLVQIITRHVDVSADLEPEAVQVLRVSATNLEIGVITEIPVLPCIDGCDGAVTVPHADLLAYVGTLPTADIDLTINHTQADITLTCGRAKATLQGIDADEYPTIPDAAGASVSFDLRAVAFARMVDRVGYAAATDDTRPVLQAVCMTSDQHRLIAATTDGFRLGQHTVTLDQPARNNDGTVAAKLEVLFPANTIKDMKVLLAGNDVLSFRIILGSDGKPAHATVRAGSTVIKTRLIDGRFPDYNRIIPVAPPIVTATVDRKDALRLAKQAAIFAKLSANILRLNVEPGIDRPGSLAMTATAAAMGTGRSEIDAITVGDLATTSGVNVKYFDDMLASLESDRVILEFRGPQNVVLARPVGDEATVCLIMPMTIRE